MFLLTIVAMVLAIPVTPDDDGHITGAITLLTLMPVIVLVLLVYFLILNLKEERNLKFALYLQSFLLLPFAGYFYYVTDLAEGFWVGLMVGSIIFIYFTVAVGAGAWVWSRN